MPLARLVIRSVRVKRRLHYLFRCKEWRAARWNQPLPNNAKNWAARRVCLVFYSSSVFALRFRNAKRRSTAVGNIPYFTPPFPRKIPR